MCFACTKAGMTVTILNVFLFVCAISQFKSQILAENVTTKTSTTLAKTAATRSTVKKLSTTISNKAVDQDDGFIVVDHPPAKLDSMPVSFFWIFFLVISTVIAIVAFFIVKNRYSDNRDQNRYQVVNNRRLFLDDLKEEEMNSEEDEEDDGEELDHIVYTYGQK